MRKGWRKIVKRENIRTVNYINDFAITPRLAKLSNKALKQI